MEVGLVIEKAIRTLLLTLCQLVYSMIVFFFNIFEKIGTASVVNDSFVMEVYERVGLILGIFMLFRMTFSAVQYVINPDLLMDKKTGVGNIVKKSFIVIALLGCTPYLFQFAFKVQNEIINADVIPKILVGSEADTDNFGINLAEYTFFNFYTINPAASDNACGENQYNAMKSTFHSSGNLNMTKNCIDLYDERNQAWAINFDYHGLLPLVVGCLLLWMIVMYTLQVAIRAFQLAYLQLIAPVPIMLYLDPKKDDQLQKWFKQCTTTYLDFFIRVGVIYFVVFVIELIMSENFFNTVEVSGGFFSNFYVTVVLIIALLVFAKKVPDLFKELFPMAGGAAKFDFGLSPKKVLNDTWAASLIGGTVGGLGAMASNAVHGYMKMNKAWNKNSVDSKLTKEQRATMDKKDIASYNSRRRAQMASRFGAVAGATGKTALSMAGGALGGARAGLKTKDITKAGEAVKTANKNRENRELMADAGYHWYNPLPVMGDKILEFAGESGDTIKNRNQALRDKAKRESDLNAGRKLYYAYGDPKPGSNERKLNPDKAFKNEEFRKSYTELGKAKGAAKEAEIALSQEQANLNAAYAYSGPNKEQVIADAQARYNTAYGNAKATQGQLELVKAKHDSNKKIYADDAKVEELFKYYSDLAPLLEAENANVKPQPQQQPAKQKTPSVPQQPARSESAVLSDYISDDDDDNNGYPFNIKPQMQPNKPGTIATSQVQQQNVNERPLAFSFSIGEEDNEKKYDIPLDITEDKLKEIVDGVGIDTLDDMVMSAYNAVSASIGKNDAQAVAAKKHQIWKFLEDQLDKKRDQEIETENSKAKPAIKYSMADYKKHKDKLKYMNEHEVDYNPNQIREQEKFVEEIERSLGIKEE